MTDFSKQFDCLDHSLLITKLHWYGLPPLFFKLVFPYFSNHTHCTKIKKKCFSNKWKNDYGVLQGSTLNPLFLIETQLVGFKNAKTLAKTVISELQITASTVSSLRGLATITWKQNLEKHLLLSFKTPKRVYFGVAFVESSSTKNVLGIHIDFDLPFHNI